jgi:putative Mg2+ transporter-C (MgtC) family protein
MPLTDLELVARLVLALVLGGLIGLERESHGRPAGFRTHILVSLGSSLIMILSIYAFSPTRLSGVLDYDPGRLAAQIVSGIGFLGAGTIMREGPTVRGLTTAASLWVVAAIGMAAGAGVYFPAVMTTLLVMITLFFLSKLERRLLPTKRQAIVIEISDEPGQLGAIASALGQLDIQIRGVEFEQKSQGHTLLELSMDFPPKLDKLRLIEMIQGVNGVLSVSYKS